MLSRKTQEVKGEQDKASGKLPAKVTQSFPEAAPSGVKK
jgi:hypothetical protein